MPIFPFERKCLKHAKNSTQQLLTDVGTFDPTVRWTRQLLWVPGLVLLVRNTFLITAKIKLANSLSKCTVVYKFTEGQGITVATQKKPTLENRSILPPPPPQGWLQGTADPPRALRAAKFLEAVTALPMGRVP